MLTSRNRRRKLLLPALILLIAAAWYYKNHHTIPVADIVNPFWWVRHWQGLDQYDPKTALLGHGDPRLPEVTLTFDDGPDPRYGPPIAALLRQKGVPATFFLVGIRVKQYPQVTKLLADDGFEIGNHTYDHQRLPALKPHEIANELRLCDQHIAQITGHHTTLMRPPGEQYDDKVLGVAKSLGYVSVGWSVGARDYDPQPPDWIAQRVIDRTGPGAIILLHQDTPATLSALPAIIDTLRARGYRFVTISQMLDHLHVQRPVPPPGS